MSYPVTAPNRRWSYPVRTLFAAVVLSLTLGTFWLAFRQQQQRIDETQRQIDRTHQQAAKDARDAIEKLHGNAVRPGRPE